MRALERRLARLEPAIDRLRPPPHRPFDGDRLTGEEWDEVGRIAELSKAGGWGGLSAADLDLLERLARKLAGEEVGACLG